MERLYRAILWLVGHGPLVVALMLLQLPCRAAQETAEREEKRELKEFLKTAMVANSNALLYRESGSPLGTVRTGFLIKGDATLHLRERIHADLPAPLGGESSVLVHPSDFSALTVDARYQLRSRHRLGVVPNVYATSGLSELPLTSQSELLDPFEGKAIILVNSKGSMLKAYQHWPPVHQHGGILAVVKTSSGLFLGYLRERHALQNSRFTWDEVCTAKDWHFLLTPKSRTSLKKGNRFMRLTTLTKRHRQAVMLSEPTQVQIKPVHYETILRRGLDGLLVELLTPTDDGFKPSEDSDAPPGTPTRPDKPGYQTYSESILEEINVNLLESGTAETLLEVEEKRKERKVETWLNGMWIIRTQYSPWKQVRVKKTVVIENDLDGGCRFTNGELIYEIQKTRFGFNLLTYEVRRNPLPTRR